MAGQGSGTLLDESKLPCLTTGTSVKYLFVDLEYAFFRCALCMFYFLSRISHVINLITWTIFAG